MLFPKMKCPGILEMAGQQFREAAFCLILLEGSHWACGSFIMHGFEVKNRNEALKAPSIRSR